MIKTIIAKLKGIYIGCDYDKYWNCREALFDSQPNKLKYLYCKHYVSITNKKNANIAYCIEVGNNFKERPILGHKLSGIVIAAEVIIGKNCLLSHKVTIGRNRGGTSYWRQCLYRTWVKIFGAIHIGNNVWIGASCVVFEDVPDNATVVLPKPRVIIKNKGYKYCVASPTDWNSIGN